MNKFMYSILIVIIVSNYVFPQSKINNSQEFNNSNNNNLLKQDSIEVEKRFKLYSNDKSNSIINLEKVPIRGIDEIIELNPGVIIQDDEIHFRAGQSGEVGYYLNGVMVNDPMNNENGIHIIDEAIDEIQVLTGYYSADMGGANSGVVKMKMKTGGDKLHGSIDARTDGFRDETKGEKVLDTYNYGHDMVVATIGGPLVSDKIRFFLAGEMNYKKDNKVRFSEGYEFSDIVNTSYTLTYDDVIDTVDLIYPNGFTPNQEDDYYSINGTLTLDLPIKLRLGGMYTGREYVSDDTPMLSLLNDRTYGYKTETMMFTAKASKFFSSKTFLEIKGSYWKYHRESNDSWFGNDWQSYYDSAAVADYTLDKYGDSSQVVHYRDAWNDKYDYYLNGFTMERNGNPRDLYLDQEREFWEIAVDFSTQYGKHHEIKIGGNYKKSLIRHFQMAPSVMEYADTNMINGYDGIGNVPVDKWMLYGAVGAWGYDIYGNKTDDKKFYNATNDGAYTDAPKEPVQFSAYMMDKIEYKDLVINAGLRFEYYDGDDYELTDPANPIVDPNDGFLADSSWIEKDPTKVVSPRIGFSFPVSDKTAFYFQYGKFVQMPELNDIYFSSFSYARQIVRQGYYFQNPVGFGLDAIKTTSYAVGFRQKLSESSALDITVFYKRVKGLVTTIEQYPAPNSTIPGPYLRYVNDGNSFVKGLELTYILKSTRRLSSYFNYSYMDSKMSVSVDGNIFKMRPMDYSQKHTGSINLDYRFGDNDGGPILQNFGINILFKYSSGHPFTKTKDSPSGGWSSYNIGVDYMFDTRGQVINEPINASTTPWIYTTDIKIDKSFKLGGITTTFYVLVNNIFNRKNVINVYEVTGSAVDDGYISDPDRLQYVSSYCGGQDYIDMYNAINIKNGQSYWDILNKQLYGHPRQIFFGVKVSF